MVIGIIGKNAIDIKNYVYRNFDISSIKHSDLIFTLVNGTVIKGILQHEDVAGNVYDEIKMTPAYTSLYDYAKNRLRSK